ncbi:RNA-directed DNA polymerase [Loktanella salsilacus]|uniref:RNA-directed DNA polymerase n=1 Tax=Loktanella salsilacus TaxID=195913 RepID=A0A1I4HB47_9RHOB|nr:RNA-directed DNA polymerase [Loktanella salsilacus]
MNLRDISSFLGFAPQHIFYLVENPDKFYTTIRIPKNSKPHSFRTLDIPYTELKGVQRAMNRKILQKQPLSECAYSYVSGKSIFSAAREFCGGKAILKMDIQDFFPSITGPRVVGLYKSLGFTDSVAYILSQLSLRNNSIAQGAPTSPAISNLIMRRFDRHMENLATSWEMDYLRYSDDIFFYKDRNFNHPKLEELATQIIEHSGFTVNVAKTRYHPRGVPRITLGLLTHGDRPRIPGPARKQYRAAFYRASRDFEWAYANKSRLKGILEWYKSIHGKDDVFNQYSAIYRNINTLKIHTSYRSQ